MKLLCTFSLIVVMTAAMVRGENIIIHGDSTLNCTRDGNRVTCHATYEYDVDTLCDTEVTTTVEPTTTPSATLPRDCHELFLNGTRTDGVYTIRPSTWPGAPFQVLCKMTLDGGWTVFQHRKDGNEDFYRSWEEYKGGFGSPTGDHWLGNEKLYFLTTTQGNYEMRIDVKNGDGHPDYLHYGLIRVGTEDNEYVLTLQDFSGSTDYDYMDFHNGMRFSTYDNDNDESPNSCVNTFRGGWWYNYCYDANLNGDYNRTDNTGVCLYNRDTSTYYYRHVYAEMKVKPTE